MNVAAFLPAEPFESLPKCCEPLLPYGAGLRAMYQDADAPHPLALLCARRERRRGRAADERYDLAPPHSITSSARASSCGGTTRPSILAVWAFMTDTCTTGKSVGLAPLRMRPV